MLIFCSANQFKITHTLLTGVIKNKDTNVLYMQQGQPVVCLVTPSVCLFHMEEFKLLSQNNKLKFKAGHGYLLLLTVASAILIWQPWHSTEGELSVSTLSWASGFKSGGHACKWSSMHTDSEGYDRRNSADVQHSTTKWMIKAILEYFWPHKSSYLFDLP